MTLLTWHQLYVLLNFLLYCFWIFIFLLFFACLPCLSHTLRAQPQLATPCNVDRQRAYKERIRRELNRTLKAEFDRRTCAELSEAVPATETLNVDPQKERAELARQGSLADRQPPASLVQLRQRLNQAGAITAPQPPQNLNGNAVQFTDAENVRHWILLDIRGNGLILSCSCSSPLHKNLNNLFSKFILNNRWTS